MKKKSLIIFIVLLMFLTSCGEKNNPPASDPPSPAGEKEQDTTEIISSKDELLPEGYIGNNEAYTFTPCDGITVSVPENALYEDTVLTFEPVSEETPMVREVIEDFREQGQYALRAWEVDAGLEADECLPGPYEVKIDLDELDIPESLRDSLYICRIADDGSYSVLNSRVEGNTLIYSSRQNSMEMMLFNSRRIVDNWLFGGVPSFLDILEYKTRAYYLINFFKKDSFYHVTEVSTDRGSFNIWWTYEDLDPGHEDKAVRMNQISEAYKKAIREDITVEKRASWDVFGLFSSNATEAELLEEALKKDAEYQKLKEGYTTPPILDTLIDQISIAMYFLKEKEKIEMPEAAVNFYLLTDEKSSAQGYGSWSYGSQSFIEINMREAKLLNQEDANGVTARENLLLTVTHELFHVCQENYHTHFFTDSTRFDEMTAVVLESDARDYYFDNGVITTKPPLTDQHTWISLEKSTDDNSAEDSIQRDQGYNLSLYYQYLREKTGKEMPVATIMKARGYFKTPVTSEILSGVFGLTGEEYEKDWFGYCKKYRKAAASLNIQKNIVAPNEWIHFDLNNTQDYAMRTIGLFQLVKTPMPLLVVPDNISTVSDLRAAYLPAGTYSVYKHGYYLPAQEGDTITGKNNRRYVTIIYGKQDGEELPGFTVYGFGQTPEVELTSSYGKQRMEITMPEPSELAKKGVIEGYYIIVDTDNGFHAQGHKTLEEMGKGVGVSFDKLYNGDNTRDVVITVTTCEYVSDNDKNYYYGITSEPVTMTLGGVPDVDPDLMVDPDPISEEDQLLSGMSFGYPLDMVLYDVSHSSSSNYESHFHSHITEAYDEIAATLIDKGMTVNADGSFTFALSASSATAHWETAANPDCYATVTSSFSIQGHMASYEELHAGEDPYYGPREEDIDYGFPVLDSGEYNGGVKAFAELPMNYDSQSRYHYVLTISGTEAELGEWNTNCNLRQAGYFEQEVRDRYGLQEGKDYLIISMRVRFKTHQTGTIESEYDKSGWMDAHTSHSDYDRNTTETFILYFVSRRPVSPYKREVYEKR